MTAIRHFGFFQEGEEWYAAILLYFYGHAGETVVRSRVSPCTRTNAQWHKGRRRVFVEPLGEGAGRPAFFGNVKKCTGKKKKHSDAWGRHRKTVFDDLRVGGGRSIRNREIDESSSFREEKRTERKRHGVRRYTCKKRAKSRRGAREKTWKRNDKRAILF